MCAEAFFTSHLELPQPVVTLLTRALHGNVI